MPEGNDISLRRLVHELSTPVGVSAMAASMLPAQIDSIVAELDASCQKKVAPLLEEWRETAALVQASLQLCIQILGNTTARPAANDDEAQPLIDLQATLKSAVLIGLARRPDLQVSYTLHFADRMQVHGDSGAWKQVIGNLVANSLLHGFDGLSQGTIRIAGALLPGNRILVHYYDDGHGFDAEAHTRLFEEGFTTRPGRGGNGLGMGIVQDLVHNKMGGRLKVHRPSKGVHISIETPC
jgi:signal transduction histidine kinase